VKAGTFVRAALVAFNDHFPLIIRPDDIWIPIVYAFSKHLELNHEELRSLFVSHEGKATIVVEADDFVLGQTPAKKWEEVIFPQFSRQVKSFIGEEIHATITTPFSTSAPADIAAYEIGLMASMQHYLSYEMHTMCGFPWIELKGTLEDWKAIRTRAEEIGKLMVPSFSSKWIPLLLTVLDKFVESFEGTVDKTFWSRMVKIVQHGRGSGSYSTVSGWISLLYPYMEKGRSNGQDPFAHLIPWQELIETDGLRPEKYPHTICTAPVKWKYLGQEILLTFQAGCVGYVQESDQPYAVRVVNGWAVTHDVAKSK